MERGRTSWRHVISAAAMVSVLAPGSLGAGTALLGTARGVRSAQLSLDGGKNWLAVGARALPILGRTEIRSTSGYVAVALSDGSMVTVLPFSALRVMETERTTEVAVVYGRVSFQLSPKTRVAIGTPEAVLEPMRSQPMSGEVFVTGAGLVGIKMTSGQLQVRQRTDAGKVMVASLEPVFLPKKPERFVFSSDDAAIPRNAKGVFTPKGESIGYLSMDGSFVVHPGVTADLTEPFPPNLVRLAMATTPAKDGTADAVPLFDVRGQYVGYLAGPMFYAYQEIGHPPQPEQAAKPAKPDAVRGLSTRTWTVIGVIAGVAAIAGGVGLAGGGGGGGGGGGHGAPPPASPGGP